MITLKRYPGMLNDGENSHYDTSDELSEWEVKQIPNCYSNIYYWYCSESYDGTGVMILESTNGFDLEYLGHCSCNGPCDAISHNPKGKYKDLQEIIDDNSLDSFEGWKYKRLAKWALTGEIDLTINTKNEN